MLVFQQRTQIHNFIGKDSWILFKLLQSNTGTSFLTTNPKPKLWNPKKLRIKPIPVANDASEQALGLLTEFHDKLTRNSTLKQNVFKIIKSLRVKQSLGATSTERVTKEEMKQYL